LVVFDRQTIIALRARHLSHRVASAILHPPYRFAKTWPRVQAQRMESDERSSAPSEPIAHLLAYYEHLHPAIPSPYWFARWFWRFFPVFWIIGCLFALIFVWHFANR
jgi:hypothetical protein